MQPRYDKQGVLSFWMVLPSKALRHVVYRRLREQYPDLNYCCEWNDVQGAGLHLTVVHWKQPGSMYHVPN